MFALSSCNKYEGKVANALNLAGSNKTELEKVLDQYKKRPADSLKYRAALFLIENMPYHNSFKKISGYEMAFDSVSKYPIDKSRKEAFRKFFGLVSSEKLGSSEKFPDVSNVNYKYLTDNIELSFEAWRNIPISKRASFEDFCNYILPYKNAEEPIEIDSRRKLNKKYAWVPALLAEGRTLKTVVDSVATEFGHRSIENMGSLFPQPLAISEVEKTRVGSCDDGVNYLVNAFRAVGIAASKETIPHWGNHHSLGHSWIYVKYGKEEYATDVSGKVALKEIFKEESIPKVQRVTYSRQEAGVFSSCTYDVTDTYVKTANIVVDNLFEAINFAPVLCVFDKSNEWKSVAFGIYRNKKYHYNDIGVNVIYMAQTVNLDEFVPVNYPFFLDRSKNVHYYKPGKTFIKAVPILRKYGLSSPRNTRNVDWMKNLNGCIIQGADNPDFRNPIMLYRIENFMSTQINRVGLPLGRKFRYVRFYSGEKESYLAKLAFFDAAGKQISGEVLEKNNTVDKWEKKGAFDENPLSFSGGKEVSLGFYFNEPKRIGFVEFQVRNDDNHIKIGNQYELFYWDKTWKTLGRQTAKDTVLYYDIPVNSLLWLKNNEAGNEEHVFAIDKNNKQRWLGFSN